VLAEYPPLQMAAQNGTRPRVYQKKILERPDFNDVGFILTD
jgi:hypothetical protein